MGPSPTGRGPADRAGLVVLDRVDPVDPAALGRVDLVDLGRAGLVVTGLAVQDLDRGQVDPVDPVDLVALGRADRAGMGRAGLVDLVVLDRVDLVDLVVLDRVDPVGRVDIRGLADRVGLVVLDRAAPGDQGMDPAGRVDPVGRENLGDQGMDPAGRVDLVGRENLGDQGMHLAGRVDLADLVDRRRIHPGVRTSGVVPRWAAPGMRRTASAHPTTVRRLRRENTDGVGMVGLHPERSRLGGTGRRPRVAGAVRRLPVVGTAHGMVRRVTGATRNAISGHSITTATTRSRCSTRFSGDGVSGSSDSGFRCTETT
jgi:hypothetical protein